MSLKDISRTLAKYSAVASPVISAGTAAVGQYFGGVTGGLLATGGNYALTSYFGAAGARGDGKSGREARAVGRKYATRSIYGSAVGAVGVAGLQAWQGAKKAGWQGATASVLGGNLFARDIQNMLPGGDKLGDFSQLTLGPDYWKSMQRPPNTAPAAGGGGFPAGLIEAGGPRGEEDQAEGGGGGLLLLGLGALALMA